MEISVLATKCRYCGEPVGRPRDETRSLTIDDLGGETIRHYAPSSSVMEAMEAFRSEHEFKSNPPVDQEPARRSLFGMSRKKTDSQGPNVGEGLPQLDERSQALASLALPTTKPTVVKKPRGPSMVQRAVQFGAIALGIAVVAFVGYYGYQYLNQEPPEPARQKVNPAEGLIARGGDPLNIVIEAAKAAREEPHSKNQQILQQAHKLFSDKVHGLLNASPWTQQTLREAAKNVNDAFNVDSSNEVRKLKEEVDQEVFAYQMSVLSINSDATEATFGLSQAVSGGGGQTQKIKVGDTVAGRFKVTAIKRDRVQLVDTRRDDRPLTYHLNDTLITSP